MHSWKQVYIIYVYCFKIGDLLLCIWMHCHDKVKKNETTFNIIRNTCATPVEKREVVVGGEAFSHSQALECVIKPTRMCLDCEEKTGAPGAKQGEQHISHPKVHQRKIQRKTPQ